MLVPRLDMRAVRCSPFVVPFALASALAVGCGHSGSSKDAADATSATGGTAGRSGTGASGGSSGAGAVSNSGAGGVSTAFMPPDRIIDWSHAGIPGGIPSKTWPIFRTLSPSGGADDSVAIQAAINAAPEHSVVLLNPGTYVLHRSSTVCSGLSDDYANGVYEAGLCIDKAVALRGSGPDKTILKYGDGANIVSLGTTYLSSKSVVFIPITAGASKGSTSITLGSASGITAGSYLVVTQDNPTDSDGNPLVDTTGYTGSCSACGHDLTNNVMSQIVHVTAVKGAVVTTERPLYIEYTNAPKAFVLPKMVENAGLENLRLEPTASSGTGIVFKNVNIESCAHCWVSSVESDMAVDRSNVYLSDVYGTEIRSNYLNDGYSHNSGETYAIFLEFRNSENLIENNIVRKARHSTIMSGGSGNVFGYNYLLDAYMGEYHNSLPESNTHGAHPYMNLWEGNVTPNIEFDFAHGSSSHNTAFRNYVDMTSTNPDTSAPMTSALYAFNIAYFNNYENVVGNVIGAWGSACRASAYELLAGVPQGATIFKLGYYDDGGTPAPDAGLAAKVAKTILRGGNWDCKTASVIFKDNVPAGSSTANYLASQSLPPSFYRAAKPQWFDTGHGKVAWPPIDPNATTKVNSIPAKLCYEQGPGTGAAFDPTTCYGQ